MGLVARIFKTEGFLEEVLKVAHKIAGMSLPVVQLIKESINAAFEMPLSEGIKNERRLFHSTFDILDRKEGMQAFLDKRPPKFTGR